MQQIHCNIPFMFDCWADLVVHLLLHGPTNTQGLSPSPRKETVVRIQLTLFQKIVTSYSSDQLDLICQIVYFHFLQSPFETFLSFSKCFLFNSNYFNGPNTYDQRIQINDRWDWNCGSLVSVTSALPTVPQLLALFLVLEPQLL